MIKFTSCLPMVCGSPASSTTRTGCYDVAEILLKVVLKTKNQIIKSNQILDKHTIDMFCSKWTRQISHLRFLHGYKIVLRNSFLQNKWRIHIYIYPHYQHLSISAILWLSANWWGCTCKVKELASELCICVCNIFTFRWVLGRESTSVVKFKINLKAYKLQYFIKYRFIYNFNF